MKKFLHWTVLIVLLVGLQEILFRAVFPLPEVKNFNRVTYTAVPPMPVTASFFARRAPAMNATFRWSSAPDGGSFLTHLNLYGFRDKTWRVNPPVNQTRVMFVGDSLVEGMMASDDETIPSGYARAAADRNEPVETMNFGIGGTGIDNYRRLMLDAVPLFRPQKIIVVIYANDLPYDPSSAPDAGTPIKPRFNSAFTPRVVSIARRALRREVLPRRWHGRATLFLPVVPDPLNPWSHSPPEFSAVDATLADAMRRGDFNPFLVDLLNQAEKALRQPTDFTLPLQRFHDIARNSQAELRIVYLPFSTQVSDYYVQFQQQYALEKNVRSLLDPKYQVHSQALAKSCAELHVPFLDLTPLLRKAEARGEHLYWNFDDHMRGSSYLRIGATIEQWAHADAVIENLAPLN
jgi:lysophospholipase L1-like esterase